MCVYVCVRAQLGKRKCSRGALTRTSGEVRELSAISLDHLTLFQLPMRHRSYTVGKYTL